MEGRKLTINLKKANTFSIVLFVGTAFVALVATKLIWGEAFNVKSVINPIMPPESDAEQKGALVVLLKTALLIGLLIGGIVVHELIHGITWGMFAPKGWKSISFGVMWKLLTPYCHCDEPMIIRHYIWGALTPLIFLGILPLIGGIAFADPNSLAFGIIFTSAAAGDIMVVWLLRHEDAFSEVLDHPSEAGCIVYDKKH